MFKIHEDPMEEYPRVGENGERDVQLRSGDPVVDKWESKVVKEEQIDFSEAFQEDDKKLYEGMLKRSREQYNKRHGITTEQVETSPQEEPETFSDDYTKESA
jgi:hypothetical protein